MSDEVKPASTLAIDGELLKQRAEQLQASKFPGYSVDEVERAIHLMLERNVQVGLINLASGSAYGREAREQTRRWLLYNRRRAAGHADV